MAQKKHPPPHPVHPSAAKIWTPELRGIIARWETLEMHVKRYSRLSLSRLRLSRITAYLEEKI